jgi:pyruvate kinase
MLQIEVRNVGLMDLRFGIQLGVDRIAVSFVRSPQDLEQARRMIEGAGSKIRLIAKIERAEVVENLDQILEVADGIMIALTSDCTAYRQLALSWDVEPLLIQPVHNAEEMFVNVVDTVVDSGLVEQGDKVVITSGVPIGTPGITSLVKVHSIGQPITA